MNLLSIPFLIEKLRAETDACGSLWRELPDGKDGQEGNPFPAF